MNTSRLAQLYRSRGVIMGSLAAIDAQIAEAWAEDEADPANDTTPAPERSTGKKAPRRGRRHVRVPIVPADATDTDVAAARTAAKRHGVMIP